MCLATLVNVKPCYVALAGLLCTLVPASLQGETTWIYAVQMTADVQNSPPAITLKWLPDQYGANSYTVYRKGKEAGGWNHIASLGGNASSYTDYNVGVGGAYEYQVVKAASRGYTGYGYIYAGIQAPFTENRGKVILVVDASVAGPLSTELARLKNDLVGDGWTVARRDVGRGDSPGNVRNVIINEYNSDPGRTKTVFLFGHVPILRSGGLNVDGHQSRQMPADAFYGDMDGWWDNPSYLPSDVELMVGRVDLWNMPGNGAPSPWPSEVEMLRNYLQKDHAWRHKRYTAPRRGLIGNRFGDFSGEAFAASGFRNFDPLIGSGKTDIANEQDGAPNGERWTSMLAANTYLWTYACGGGGYTSIGAMGTHGQYGDAWSTDLVAQDSKAVFFMLMGSWFGEWDSTDNLMRAVLATPSMGLTCSWAGRPHWYYHHMGLGEPIGYSAKITMNNNGLYRNEVNNQQRGVHIALMGDPTLRMHQVAPPQNATASSVSGGTRISWSPSSDSVIGYHVYRASSGNGPFDRLTSSPVGGTSYTDSSGSGTYMVRAVQLENTPSGTYLNLSQGDFANAGGGDPPPPPPPPDDDTIAPSVTINSPAAGATVSGSSVWLRGAASDNVRVAGVQYRLDGANLGAEIWVPPYDLLWNLNGVASGAHRIAAIVRDNAGNRSAFGPITVYVNNGAPGGSGVERVWFDDSVPTGAQKFGQGESWKWISTPKYSGNVAHRSALATQLHEHWFDSAQAKLNVNVGDSLFTWVYLDPTAPPRQLMLQWSDGSWEHRAYWGESLINFGTEGTDGRRYMGPVPATGRWVRLKVPASQVGLEGKALQGMAFSLWGGRATWDRAGKLIRK